MRGRFAEYLCTCRLGRSNIILVHLKSDMSLFTSARWGTLETGVCVKEFTFIPAIGRISENATAGGRLVFGLLSCPLHEKSIRTTWMTVNSWWCHTGEKAWRGRCCVIPSLMQSRCNLELCTTCTGELIGVVQRVKRIRKSKTGEESTCHVLRKV